MPRRHTDEGKQVGLIGHLFCVFGWFENVELASAEWYTRGSGPRFPITWTSNEG